MCLPMDPIGALCTRSEYDPSTHACQLKRLAAGAYLGLFRSPIPVL